MRKFTTILTLSSLMIGLSACETVKEAAGALNTGTNSAPALTNSEVISGLKEALTVGIQNSVNLTSVTDGFLKNEAIRLPFPPDALKVRQKAMDWGLSGQVEKFETTLNRAAEDAVTESAPIFTKAITSMTITDAKTWNPPASTVPEIEPVFAIEITRKTGCKL